MPSNKTAQYRQRINSDPVARAQLLAKRRKNYKRRNEAASGANPDHPPIRSLSDHEVSKKRKRWRENQRKHRAAAKHARTVLDFTPESFEEPPELARPRPSQPIPSPPPQSPPVEPVPHQAVSPSPPSPLPGEPLASSTPDQPRKEQRVHERLKNKNAELRKQLFMLRKQLSRAQLRNEQLRKGLQREKQKGQQKKKNTKKMTKQKKASRSAPVCTFLSRDENSRQLPGKKD